MSRRLVQGWAAARGIVLLGFVWSCGGAQSFPAGATTSSGQRPLAPAQSPSPSDGSSTHPAPAKHAAHEPITVGCRRDDGKVECGLSNGRVWDVQLRRFPSPEPTEDGEAKSEPVANSGTILTGAPDGSLVAFDYEGTPLFQLGVPGAVTKIEPAFDEGAFAVVDDTGTITVVHPDGTVKETPARVSWTPTAAYAVERATHRGEPLSTVDAVLAVAKDDAWALVRGDTGPDSGAEPPSLFHYDGQAWSDLGPPRVRFPHEVFVQGQPAARGTFHATGLALDPSGKLVAVGLRVHEYRAQMCLLERAGAGWRERREFLPLTVKLSEQYYLGATTVTYAKSAGGREALCIGSDFAATPRCFVLDPGKSPRPLRLPDTSPLGGGYDDGPRWGFEVPLLFFGETALRVNGWTMGTSELFGVKGSTLGRFDGTAPTERETPLPPPIWSVWASATNDVWLSGEDHVTHYDGERFQRVFGLRSTRGFQVTGSGPNDVWAFGGAGLWHITKPRTARPPLRARGADAPAASEPSTPIAMGPTDRSYTLERVTLPVDRGEVLRSAISIAVGPSNTIWFHDGVRVVEYDGTRGRVVYQAPTPEPFYCWSDPEPDCEVCASCTPRRPYPLACHRCVAPTATGEGAIITEFGLSSVTHGKADPSLGLGPINAVTPSPSGKIWTVSALREPSLPPVVVFDAQGPRLLSGLPPAAYSDAAVHADDDVWLVGGLTGDGDGLRAWPEGEGTVVHYDGKRYDRYRGPDGALLSAAAVGPAEVWAVGLGGGLVHVKGTRSSAWHLEKQGRRFEPILRDVAAPSSNDVWIAGDESTLLHWDGRSLHTLDTTRTGKNAALTAVIPPGKTPGWVVAPHGIWRIEVVK